MKVDELIKYYPRLWHMAHDGAWDAIRDRGLLSAGALLDLYGHKGAARSQLFSQRRPQSVVLKHAGLPNAILRDQIPMTDKALNKCLDDQLTPKDWYEIINSRTYFWVSQKRVRKLLSAKAYRKDVQTVLTLDTAGLVAAHSKNIRLSPINSGSTIYNPQRRGKDLFKRIEDFPYDDRRRSRSRDANVVELVVNHSVPNVRDFVLAVHRVKADKILQTIWQSPRASNEDRP